MFVEHHLVDLRKEGYTASAWLRYVRRALAFARERALANPAAVRSILSVGLLLFSLTLAASVALALLGEPALGRQIFAWTVLGLFPMIALVLLHVDLIRAPDGTPLDAIGWPSVITLARVALVPSFLIAVLGGRFRLAFFVFCAAILSDVIDGWVARHFGQETRFGAILDPLADILCSFWLFVGLWLGGLVPWPLIVLATTRMLMLLVGGGYLYVTHGPPRIQSTIPGKLTGLVLTALVAMRLFAHAFPAASGDLLTPIVIDAIGAILAFTLLYGWTIGWLNLRRLRSLSAGQIVTDVRFRA
jgi:cardiolipin synthase